MKNNQKEYDIKFRNKNKLKYERSLRASNRQENYNFINTTNKLSLSYEIIGNLVLKKEYYLNKSSESIWTDRMSRVSAPLGAEMFIENERSISEVFLGGPRYYFHELNQDLELRNNSNSDNNNNSDDDNNDNNSSITSLNKTTTTTTNIITKYKKPKFPDARSRFPYDRVAHKSAKIITRLFRYNLNRRNRAANVIKRSIKYYMSRKLSQLETLLWNECITMVQGMFRRRRNLFRHNAKYLREKREKQLEQKKLARLEDIRRNKEGARKIKLTIAYYHLTRRAREFIHRKRKERGVRKRQFIFACRLQAIYRGQKLRRQLKKRQDAGIFILCWFRKYWRKKHYKDAIKIQRAYRNYRLRQSVILIQKTIRGKIGRRKKEKLVIELIAAERNRANRECLVLTDYFHRMSLDTKWMNDEEQVPFITTEDHLKRIDFYCLAVLTANPIQINEKYLKSIHPADFGEDDYAEIAPKLVSTSNDNHEQRIVKAILNIYSNRPGSCMDGFIFSLIKEAGLLKPKKSSQLSDDAWNTLEKIPLLNIHSLSQILEPSTSLLFRVNINGRGRYLPISVLQQTILINRWTLHFEYIIRRKLKLFRKIYPPRRFCPQCMEPMIFDGELYDHRRCCRNGFPSWMLNDMKDIFNSLKQVCKNMQVIKYKRDYYHDQLHLLEGLKLGSSNASKNDDTNSNNNSNNVNNVSDNNDNNEKETDEKVSNQVVNNIEKNQVGDKQKQSKTQLSNQNNNNQVSKNDNNSKNKSNKNNDSKKSPSKK